MTTPVDTINRTTRYDMGSYGMVTVSYGPYMRFDDAVHALAAWMALHEFLDGRRYKSPHVRQIAKAIRARADAIFAEHSK